LGQQELLLDLAWEENSAFTLAVSGPSVQVALKLGKARICFRGGEHPLIHSYCISSNVYARGEEASHCKVCNDFMLWKTTIMQPGAWG